MISLKLNKIRKKLDKLDDNLLLLVKKRTNLVNQVIQTKKYKNQIVDNKRINIILLSAYFFLLFRIFICPRHLILSSRIADDKVPLLLENSERLFFSGSPLLSEAIARSY